MQASREYSIKDTVLSRWKQEFLERASQVFEQPKAKDQNEALSRQLESMQQQLERSEVRDPLADRCPCIR